MSVRTKFRRFYECDTEAERSLLWDGDSLISCLDTGKYYKIYAGNYVEIPADEVIFQSPIPLNKVSISGVKDGTRFLRDDGAWAVPPGGGGGFAFTALTDVPSSYASQSLKTVRVNAAETGLEFYTPTFISLTSLSSSATGLTYTNTTGVFSLTSGYVIPTTTEETNWNTAYTNRITSLTTAGSSGSATLISNVLNIPTYTLAGLGGIPTGTAWLLASGGLLTGVNTLTSNQPNGFVFNGTWTATATSQQHMGFTGNITGRAGQAADIVNGYTFTPNLAAGTNGQTLNGVLINPTFSGTGTYNILKLQNAGVDVLFVTPTGLKLGNGNPVYSYIDISNLSLGSLYIYSYHNETHSRLSATGENWVNFFDTNSGNTSSNYLFNVGSTASPSMFQVFQQGVRITGSIQSTDWQPALKITPGNHNTISAELLGATTNYATQTLTIAGNYATQRFNYIQAPAITSGSVWSVTDAYSLYVEGPTQAGSALVTNKWALGLSGNAYVSGKVNIGMSTSAITALSVAAVNPTNAAGGFYAASGQSSSIFFVSDSTGATAYLNVLPTGINMLGAVVIAGGGSLTISTGGTGDDLLRLSNVSYPREWRLGVLASTGAFNIRDFTGSVNSFSIAPVTYRLSNIGTITGGDFPASLGKIQAGGYGAVGTNYYYDFTANTAKYIYADWAAAIEFSAGSFIFKGSDTTGPAGGNITWNAANMTLSATGALTIKGRALGYPMVTIGEAAHTARVTGAGADYFLAGGGGGYPTRFLGNGGSWLNFVMFDGAYNASYMDFYNEVLGSFSNSNYTVSSATTQVSSTAQVFRALLWTGTGIGTTNGFSMLRNDASTTVTGLHYLTLYKDTSGSTQVTVAPNFTTPTIRFNSQGLGTIDPDPSVTTGHIGTRGFQQWQYVTATGQLIGYNPNLGTYGYFNEWGVDSYINVTSANSLFLATSNTTRMTIDASGNLYFKAAPANDNALTQLLARDGTAGQIKYVDASTFAPATSSTAYWSTATGGTLTGVNTITSNNANQLLFTGAWTATANNQSHIEFGGTFTSRNTASDVLYGYLFDPTLTRNVGNPATQTAYGVYINPTFTNSFTSQFALGVNGAVLVTGNISGNSLNQSISLSASGAAISAETLKANVNLYIGGGLDTPTFRKPSTGNLTIGSFSSGFRGVTITQDAISASAWGPVLTVVPGANSNLVASTEYFDNYFRGSTKTWAAAGLAWNQRFNYFEGSVITTGAPTNAYTVYIDPPTGSGGTLYALGLNGKLAINNASIQFNGSNGVVMNTTAPMIIYGPAAQTTGSVSLQSLNAMSAAAATYVGVNVQFTNNLQTNGIHKSLEITGSFTPSSSTGTVLYGIDYNPTLNFAGGTPVHYSFRSTSGSVLLANSSSDTLTSGVRLDVRGIGTAGMAFRIADSANAQRLVVLESGGLNIYSGAVRIYEPSFISNVGFTYTAYGSGANYTGADAFTVIGASGGGVAYISSSGLAGVVGASMPWGFKTDNTLTPGSSGAVNYQLFGMGNVASTSPATLSLAATTGANNYRLIYFNFNINTTGGTSNLYGIDYNPSLTSSTGLTHYSIRTTSGSVLLANSSSDTLTASTRIDVRGITSGNIFVGKDQGGTNTRMTLTDAGVLSLGVAPSTEGTPSTAILLVRNTGGNITSVVAPGAATGRFLTDSFTWATPAGAASSGTTIQKGNGSGGFTATDLVESSGDLTLGASGVTGGTIRVLTTAGTGAGYPLHIRTSGTNAVVIGNISNAYTTNPFFIYGPTANFRYSTDATPGNYEFYKSRGSFASPTTVVTADSLGQINWYGNTTITSTWANGARIEAIVNGTVSSGIVPTDLVLSVGNASGVLTERFRIAANGLLSFSSNAGGGGTVNFLRADGTWAAPTGWAVTGSTSLTGAVTIDGAFNITIGTDTAARTYGFGTGATLTATTKTMNIGTGGVSGSTTLLNLGSSVSGSVNVVGIGGAIRGSGTSTYPSAQVGAAIMMGNVSGVDANFGANQYYDGTWKAMVTGASNLLNMNAGVFDFQAAVSVTGGTATTNVSLLTISSSLVTIGVNQTKLVGGSPNILFADNSLGGTANTSWYNLGVSNLAEGDFYISKYNGSTYDIAFYIDASRRIGIGVTPVTTIDILNSVTLGSTAGNSNLIYRLSATGAVNTFQNRIWTVRKSSGSDWLTALWHDAISIDTSFVTPHTDTKTFWERDPNSDIQSWGTGASTYMKLVSTGIELTNSGQGLKLTGTNSNANANTLDAYEEGTFTPTIAFGGAATGVTYTSQIGTYVRIGSIMHVRMRITLSSKGSSTGQLQITGLPATSINNGAYGGAAIFGYLGSLSSVQSSFTGIVPANTTRMDVYNVATGGSAAVTDTSITNTSDFIISLSYTTA